MFFNFNRGEEGLHMITRLLPLEKGSSQCPWWWTKLGWSGMAVEHTGRFKTYVEHLKHCLWYRRLSTTMASLADTLDRSNPHTWHCLVTSTKSLVLCDGVVSTGRHSLLLLGSMVRAVPEYSEFCFCDELRLVWETHCFLEAKVLRIKNWVN